MAWKLDNPLYSLSDEREQQEILKKWEEEPMGGLNSDNNRLPFPFTFLIGLIILTAFLITMPIWGQRPTAALYTDYVKLMNSPEVQKLASPEDKMRYISNEAYRMATTGRQKGQLERHPIDWDDLQMIAPQIVELQQKTPYLADYSVIGDQVVLANFEGNFRADGTRERQQPWWDRGFTIDVFYVSYFIIAMIIVTKRLPHFSKKPKVRKG